MKNVQTLAAAAACAIALGTSGTATAAVGTPADTMILGFAGNITSYNSPAQFADQEATVLGLEASAGAGYGFLVAMLVDNWSTIASTPGIQHIDLRSPDINMNTVTPIGATESYAFPPFSDLPNNTNGTGTLTVINGVPVSVEYMLDRDALRPFDQWFTDRGFVDFGLEEVTVWGGGFNYIEEFVIEERFGQAFEGVETMDVWVVGHGPDDFDFNVGPTVPYGQASVTATVVPLPAAAWLFMSSIGLMGLLSRRRKA